MSIQIPSYIQAALARLYARGYEACVVGGCVRDALMGRAPNDWDVCTSALPPETKAAFEGFRVIETGLKHGTVTVLIDREPVEITTYRVDGEYSDSRHPDSVAFTRSLREDLARRDFTVNAMAYAPEDAVGCCGLTDPFGGQRDLSSGVLRCVGDAEQRFTEDALRILRALRFSSTLGFEIEERTADAAERLRDRLSRVSPERRLTELRKLLVGRDAGRVLTDFPAVVEAAVPGLSSEAILAHAAAVGSAPAELDVRLALLLRDTDASSILRNLRSDRTLLDRTAFLVGHLDVPLPHDRPGLKRLLRDAGEEATRALFAAKHADASELDAVLCSGECWSLGQLAVGGKALLDAGVPAGPALGERLNALLNRVIDGELPNERDALLRAAVCGSSAGSEPSENQK